MPKDNSADDGKLDLADTTAFDRQSFEAKFARIKEATGAKSDSELAKFLGMKQASVASAKKRRQIPTGWIENIAKRFNVSTDWLFFGGEKSQPLTGALCEVEPLHGHAGAGAVIRTAQRDYGLVLVPKVKARLSAGNGSLETSDETEGLYAFRETWCRSKGQPGNMVLMEVTGDSMAPAIESGDTVLIDQSKRDVIVGGVYAVGIDEDVLVKYIDRLPGKLVLRSENERYAPIEIDLNQEHVNVRIIGRVIWWCREAR